ncbi:hypothetical protein APS_1790 [Acetobacter pasteurianus subsp. pasteurianus LMG 1262 = NBRC 106471]|nr:hypothetical protein APS_1790 [Acetobacter pasteurianus subsp. pasteurianus LMG 1262 = NBRC 106471]
MYHLLQNYRYNKKYISLLAFISLLAYFRKYYYKCQLDHTHRFCL